MDQDATAAVAEAYHDNIEAARRWFEIMGEQQALLRNALEDGQKIDWEAFKTAFKSAAEGERYDSETVDYFLSTYLEQTIAAYRRMDVIGQLADPSNRDEVLRIFTEQYPEVAGTTVDETGYDTGYDAADQAIRHDSYVEQPVAEDAGEAERPAEEPFDEQAWLAFLVAQWAQSDKTWPRFGAQVAANAPHSYQTAVATFRQYVDDHPDKGKALAQYGLDGGTVAAPADQGIVAPKVEASKGETEAEAALREAVAEAQTAMSRIIAENPELADLSEEDRQKALAEALQEFVRTGGR